MTFRAAIYESGHYQNYRKLIQTLKSVSKKGGKHNTELVSQTGLRLIQE